MASALSFAFGGDTGVQTPEELASKRAIVQALMQPTGKAPRNLGEGLSALGEAFGARMAKADLAKNVADNQAWQAANPPPMFAPLTDAVMNQRNGGATATTAPAPNAIPGTNASVDAGKPGQVLAQTLMPPPPAPTVGNGSNYGPSSAFSGGPALAPPVPAPVNAVADAAPPAPPQTDPNASVVTPTAGPPVNPNMPPALSQGQGQALPQGTGQQQPNAITGQLQALMQYARDPHFAMARPEQQQMVLNQIQLLQSQLMPMAQIQMQEAQTTLAKNKLEMDIMQHPAQYAPRPAWGQIGADMYGRPQYGYPPAYDPTKAGQAQTAQPPAGQATSAQDMTGLNGEDYIQNLAVTKGTGYANQVKAIIEGRAPYPTGMLIKTPYGQQLATDVTQADPTFETGNAQSRNKLRSDATSGSLGKSTNAINTALVHLNQVTDDALKLPNGNYPIINSGKAWLTGNTGGDPYSNFNTTMGKVASELTSAYRGGGGNEADIQRELGNISPTSSPTQILGSLLNTAKLLKGKIDANQAQVDKGMGPMGGKIELSSPEVDKIINRLETLHAKAASGQPLNEDAPPQSSQAPVQVKSETDWAAVPKGTQYMAPDGSMRIKQ